MSHLLDIQLELVYTVLLNSSGQSPTKARNELRFRLVQRFPVGAKGMSECRQLRRAM